MDCECFLDPLPPLPLEVFHIVLSALDPQDLCRAALVSHAWRSACADQRLWDRFWFACRTTNAEADCPQGRVCHVAVPDGRVAGRLWVFGGDVGNPFGGFIIGVHSSLWALDVGPALSCRWTPVELRGGPRLTEHSAVVHDGSLWVFGGNNGASGAGFSNRVCRITVGSGRTDDQGRLVEVCEDVPVEAPLPRPRSAHTAVVYNREMIVFGGWDNTRSFGDLWVLNLDTCRWREVEQTGDVPSPRRTHKAAVVGNKMYLYGGWCTGQPTESFGDMYCLDLDTWVWKRLRVEGDIPVGRARCSLTAHPELPILYMIGGWNRKTHFAEFYAFHILQSRWRRLDSNLGLLTDGIGQHSCCVSGNTLVVFGGYVHAQKQCSNTVYLHRIASNEFMLPRGETFRA
eukprot:m51a1_g828 hypothetical protein (400) ;mRNA; f:722662-724423